MNNGPKQRDKSFLPSSEDPMKRIATELKNKFFVSNTLREGEEEGKDRSDTKERGVGKEGRNKANSLLRRNLNVYYSFFALSRNLFLERTKYIDKASFRPAENSVSFLFEKRSPLNNILTRAGLTNHFSPKSRVDRFHSSTMEHRYITYTGYRKWSHTIQCTLSSFSRHVRCYTDSQKGL